MHNARRPKGHHTAIHYDALPGIVKALQATQTKANLALEFVILTAARTGEARAMRIDEIDFDKALWTVPPERMKTGNAHVVPLCERAVAILKLVVKVDADLKDFVFEGAKPGQLIGENALLHALKAVAPGATTHGCRSSFRDWCGDRTNFPREIAEAALAHAVGNEVEQA
jgi:integrase